MNRRGAEMSAAIEAVAAACRVAGRVQRDLARVRELTKDDRSPVTVADFAVQAVVARVLERRLGGVLVVGEEHAGVLRRPEHGTLRREVVQAVAEHEPGVESGDVLDSIDRCDHDASAPAYWTLDPVDGTKGFLRGEQYAIALGLVEDGRVVLGVLGCPNLPREQRVPPGRAGGPGTLYAAASGEGCTELSADEPAAPPGRVHAAAWAGGTVRICESVESEHSRHDDTLRVLDDLAVPVEYVRIDSQCKYALVARGQADAYLRMPTRRGYVEKVWDHAAGAIVASEAGAVVSDITGTPLDFGRGRGLEANRGIVCAAPSLHGRLVEAIERLGLAAPV
jgi:3'(2'), 5'-bisphosphate nucleotidase